MKLRFIFYVIVAIAFQVLLGYLTGLGQGGIGMLTFIVLIEIDPNFNLSYFLKKKKNEDQSS